MRFDEIVEAIDAGKDHVERASETDTFGDMRVQLQLARQTLKRAIEGIEIQIQGSIGSPTLIKKISR